MPAPHESPDAAPRRLPLRYRLPLLLLPAHVRAEHARELEADLLASRPSLLPFVADVARAGAGAHLDVLRQDLVQAWRHLRRNPAFGIVAALTLAIGIGGNVTFFALVDGVLIRPYPYAGAARLVSVTEENAARGLFEFGISPANFADVMRDTSIYAAGALYQSRTGTLRNGDQRERIAFTAVGGDFFHVLVDRPQLGRTLQPDDDVPGGNAVLLSDAFWRREFGGDPDVVGRELVVDGAHWRVIGVMPPSFTFPSPRTQFWRPLQLPESERQMRGTRSAAAVARLRPTATLQAAVAAAQRASAALASTYPDQDGGWTLLVRRWGAAQTSDVRGALLLVWGMGTLVLFIAIANTACLLLTRTVVREREFALRTALGARHGRIVRQLVTEALVLAAGAAALGVGVAALVLARLRPLLGGFVPRMQTVAVDGRAVAYAGLLAVVAVAILSVVTEWAGRGGRRRSALGTTRHAMTHRGRRLQRLIVGGEVGLATFVLVAAALILRTLVALLSQPMGFDARDAVTFRIEPPMHVAVEGPVESVIAALNRDRARAVEQYTTLLRGLEALPGVQHAGAITRLPLTGNWWITGVGVPGQPVDDAHLLAVYERPVTSGYFAAMGTRVLRGRDFGAEDRAGSEPVLVVDAELARQVWGDADPVGQHLLLIGPPKQPPVPARVIGVVETIHMNRLDADLRPTMYMPASQAGEGFGRNWGMDVVVRGTRRVTERDVRRLASAAFPDAVTFGMTSLGDVVASSTASRRFQLVVIGAFGAIALLLTMVGVGGVFLLTVRDRRDELAVRLALGAEPARLWWSIERQGLALSGAGAAAGLAAALAGARLFSNFVYRVPVRDPGAFAAAALLMLVAAAAASAIPATRAMRIDPAVTMRQ